MKRSLIASLPAGFFRMPISYSDETKRSHIVAFAEKDSVHRHGVIINAIKSNICFEYNKIIACEHIAKV